MPISSRMRFELVNGVSKNDIESNKFKIYLHKCPDGIYVGVTEDPVRRWQEHYYEAMQEGNPNYNEPVKRAIRKYGQNFTHYIVAVASFERASRKKEAEAIEFYGANLNARPEAIEGERHCSFKSLESQVSTAIMLEKTGREGAHYSRSDEQRKPVKARVVYDRGRKRLVSVSNSNFPSGLLVECSRSEREKLVVGDIVVVDVALSSKPNGTKYLVAAKTATLKTV